MKNKIVAMRLEDKKITQLREAHNVSKPDLADAMYSDVAKVYKVEDGTAQYSDTQLNFLKKFFDIEDMPLSELECAATKSRLYMMRDYNRERRFAKVKGMLDEMAKLVNLDPCDDNLPMLYRLFEVAYLIATYQLSAAEDKLAYLNSRMGDMSTEHLYYYYGNMGVLRIYQSRYEEGLDFCEQALKILKDNKDFVPDDSEIVHLWIASCYSYLDYPVRAILHFLKTRDLNTAKGNNRFDLFLNCTLAFNYIRINELEEAEKLLKSCLIQASANKDNYNLGLTLLGFGLLYKKIKNWSASVEHFYQALKYFEKDTQHYLASLYQKIKCIAIPL